MSALTELLRPAPDDQLAELILRAAEANALRRAVFSQPCDAADERVRATLTQKVIGGQPVLQLETWYTDHKARQENRSVAQARLFLVQVIGAYRQVNVLSDAGDCQLKRSRSGRVTLTGAEKADRALAAGTFVPTSLPGGNNRVKRHILTGGEPFLRELGVSDAGGRVLDKKQSKFRQINRFLELLRDVEGRLPAEGPLTVCDLCCGKSYLSFAVYHYLHEVLGREVRMYGVDLKPDVVASCNRIAQALGYTGLSFFCGDVGAFVLPEGEQVNLTVSLHACDVATDLVLNRAVAWKSNVILSTPCCHHALNHTLECPELAFLTRYSMLRQKLCDAATDGLRLLRLEAEGYATEALELIDPEETPKNVMLRAVRRRTPDPAAMARAREEYERALSFLLPPGGSCPGL